MTLAKVRLLAAEHGFSFRYSDGEYRICPRGCGESAAYYTTDRQDAIDTLLNWNRPSDDR